MKTTRTVNDRTAELYQPFLVLSGLMLDNDKAANVTVSNGRIINSGDRTTAVGYALPGLAESLSGGQTDPWTALIPDTVVIEADVADFSLLTTVTVVDNTFLQKMDMDDVRTLDDLKDAAEKLTDASGQLSEGSARLSGGITELANRAPALREVAAGPERTERHIPDFFRGARRPGRSGSVHFEAGRHRLRACRGQTCARPLAGGSKIEMKRMRVFAGTVPKSESGRSFRSPVPFSCAGCRWRNIK